MNLKELKYKLSELQKGISFNEEKHVYYIDGQKVISVTQLIKKLTPKFDPEGKIAERVALHEGLTKEQIQRKWHLKMTDAAIKGTILHKAAEYVALDMDRMVKLPEEITSHLTHIYDFFAEITSSGSSILYPEAILYNEGYKIAGTVDLLTMNHDTDKIDIYDYKTNEKLIGDDYGEKMLSPISCLSNTKLVKYSLQLSIYAMLLELVGFKVGDLYIVHLQPDKYDIIKCDRLEDETEWVLKPL